ncbi:MAG: SDR family oxidoreductase [Dinghuibacter sp.]|nr:SDR family oxidoreductase [Dinghuibacter sp.]
MSDSIAIIGVSFELPKMSNWTDLQNSLSDKTSYIGDMPPERLKEIQKVAGNIAMSKAGYISEIDRFDNEYFGFTERESVKTFPEHRLFLLHAMRAFYHAGYNESMLKGTKTGVFYTASKSAYHWMSGVSDLSFGHIDMVAGIEGTRLAKYLDTWGPVMSVNTSCSSSLVAINVARQSLNEHECDMAIVGGVKILTVTRESSMNNVVHSKKEECRPFDNDADGMMNGEGAVFFVLKRYADAVKDRDNILGEIKGVGINHGGNRIASLTAPSAGAQTEAILQAWNRAGVDAGRIRYIEAHGTATILGDPIEIEGVKQAFTQAGAGNGAASCGISSFKGQIGHLDYLSGLAGLLRLVATMHAQTIPVQPNFSRLNHYFQIGNTGLYIPEKTNPWPGEQGERIGGVSSFGMTGTNVHLVVSCKEQTAPPAAPASNRHYVQVSHRSLQGLNHYTTYIAQKAAALEREEDILALCAKLNRVFQPDKFNRAISYNTREELVAALNTPYTPAPGERVFLLIDAEVLHYPEEQVAAIFNENLFIKQAWDQYVAIPPEQIKNDRLTHVLFQFAIYKYLQEKLGPGLKFIVPRGGSILNALLKSEITISGSAEWLAKGTPLHDTINEDAFKKYVQENLAGKEITIVDFSNRDKQRFDHPGLNLHVINGAFTGSDRCLLYTDLLSAGINPLRTAYNPVFNHIHLPFYTLKRFWPEIQAKPLAAHAVQNGTTPGSAADAPAPVISKAAIQQRVRESWVAVLETGDFSDEDDFFELGGTSLLAMDMIDEIAKRVPKVNISHQTIYTHTSILQITEFICSQLEAPQQKIATANTVAPQVSRTEIEQTIGECWSLVLEATGFGKEENFFELGGTSLSAMDMVDEVKKRLPGVQLTYEEIFSGATISKMTDKIFDRLNNGAAPAPAANKEQPLPPAGVRETHYQEMLGVLKKEQYERTVPRNVFITGATGLLGMHILNYLIVHTPATIYCLVRGTKEESAEERLWSVYESNFEAANRERVVVVEGDLLRENLGIQEPYGGWLQAGIIFHAAGSPKFMSNEHIEDHINYAGTRNVVNWANRHQIEKLVLVSTVGIVGETMPAAIENFYETDVNLGQQNGELVHGASKLKAEEYVYQHYRYKSYTFRLPNIGGRYSDGGFPVNLNKNLMWLRLKALTALKYYSRESLLGNSGVGLMPVDVLAALIAEISFAGVETLGIYHLNHREYYTNGEILRCMEKVGFHAEEIANEQFINYLASEKSFKNSYHQVAKKEHKFVCRADATNEIISRLNLDKFLQFDRLQYLERLITANLNRAGFFNAPSTVENMNRTGQ